VEVGFGKGLFLLTAGQQLPSVNFLGIEVLRKYQLFTANRLAKRELSNVRLVLADARSFLRDCVADASLQAIHVYFPDPWGTKRHHRRRVFAPEFAAEGARPLRPGGRLSGASDGPESFEIITALIAQQPRLRPVRVERSKEPAHDLNYL